MGDEASRRPRISALTRNIIVIALIAAVLSSLGLLNATPATATGNIEEIHDHEPDRDFRSGSVSPTAAQTRAASGLDATVRWNRFGTPQSLTQPGGFLATNVRGSNAHNAARNFLANNAAVFGLSANYLRNPASLRFVNETPMAGSEGHAVFFRQQFGELPAIKDGSVTVGLTGSASEGWDVAYASSSLTRDTRLARSGASLSAEDAWLAAARALGEDFTAADITATREDRLKGGDLRSNFTLLSVEGLFREQQVRLTAVPTPRDGVVPAYETIFLRDEGGEAEAFTSFVGANRGNILFRANNVQQLMQATEPPPAPTAQTFDGSFDENSCSANPQNGPFAVPSGTRSLSVTVNATNEANDIVLQLFYAGQMVAEADTLGSPETIQYEPPDGVPAGDYFVRVCSFENAQPLPPNTYSGFLVANNAGGTPSGLPYPPKWNYFFANPPVGATNASYPSDDTRQVACWNTLAYGDPPPPGCDIDAANKASRAPWDTNPRAAFTPTFTTVGNNARTAESWFSPLAPGPTGFRPVSETRNYDYPWTNAWYTSKCSPTNFVPGAGNDISAATAALFANHNRIHDWSYNLGFTEQAYNLQDSNFGTTGPNRENDPELGDVQAGAVTGGAPSYLGRDNANQITLNDGIAPITNMYLWQPISAAFYAPCVDGDYDMSVIGHEYGHAIQNRMVAGPDAGLSGLQGRSMGESWSDLTAVEYLYEYGYDPGEGVNRYAVGPYVTGAKQTGIRNYGMNDSPLNYSNIDYDPNGTTSPHADGEIWSAANFDIRQLLMDKYEAQFPSAPGTPLQQQCADGERPADQCPGNRRWAQIFHDAFLLLPSSISFLDARDAYLAADQMRFGGANQKELWLAFARRGMGEGASSAGSDDRDPVPSFASPLENNASITFRPTAPNGNAINNFRVYVGDYEARAVPVADQGRRTARFAPGTYQFVVQAPGYGLLRYETTFTAGQTATRNIPMVTNWASLSEGARPTATSDGVSGPDGSSATQLIDETERSNWRADGPPIEGKQVTVDLRGGTHLVGRVNVSAFLRPQEQSNRFGDTNTQSRFSALRGFDILTCRASAANANCSDPNRGFSEVYTAQGNTQTGPFPADVPRPLAPEISFQSFNVRDTNATHVQIRVNTNQCTGAPDYQGDQDADPTNNSDCPSGSTQDDAVRAAELEVFSR